MSCARTGSATAFALTILLLGRCASGWYGFWAGLSTAVGYALLPRVFGHAHLASLESITNLMLALAGLSIPQFWFREDPPTARTALLTGLLMGLALLTKIQAIFLPPVVILWSLWRWRKRAMLPLLIWGTTALLVMQIGWPTLWFDAPWSLIQFFRGTGSRLELGVWYSGERFTDKSVPRSYIWWMVWSTLPTKFICAPFLERGAFWRGQGRVDNPRLKWTPREMFLFWMALFPLVLFSLPRVPIYDMERLWMPAVIGWSVLFGRAVQWIIEAFIARGFWPQLVKAFVLLTLLIPLLNLWRMSPVYLSSCSGLSGGLRGAERNGQELNYWSDAISRSLQTAIVDACPAGSTIAVSPVLHQFQVEEMIRQSPILRRHGVRLVADGDPSESPRLLLQFSRRADLPAGRLPRPVGAEVLAEVERDGVVLAGLYQLPGDPP